MNSYSQPELKALSLGSAAELCGEIREYLTKNVTELGGHLASNLGIVEISLALLRVFDPPADKIIYDTGHQSYVHKLLTGRLDRFPTLRSFGGLSGFTKRSESVFDPFGAGHCSTSISAALGFARADRLSGKTDSHTIAVIGDGAFSGGLVYEALNNIDTADRLIIILNDNEMSISKNVGLMAEYLNRIRTTDHYYSIKHKSEELISSVPYIGTAAADVLRHVKNNVKTLILKNNLFEQLGVYYLGPADGNDLRQTELLLREAKLQKRPVIIHLHTVKGKGYAPAELNPSAYHSVSAHPECACDSFSGSSEAVKKGGSAASTFSDIFGKKLLRLAAADKRIVAVTAAMTDGVGLGQFRRKFPDRFFDVGIAEEHAVTFCAGLSAGGMIPVFAVYSTFFQRAFDELFHDIALQGLHAVICLDRAGIVGEDGPTHHGLFDIPITRSVPNVSIYSPATAAELNACLSFACSEKQSGAAIIRYPKGKPHPSVAEAFSSPKPASVFPESPSECEAVIVTYGRLAQSALSARIMLEKRGIKAAVIKFLRLKPFSPEALIKLIGRTGKPSILYFLEEGIQSGGFSEAVVSALALLPAEQSAQFRKDGAMPKMFIRALPDSFIPQGETELLMKYCGLDAESVTEEISSLLNN